MSCDENVVITFGVFFNLKSRPIEKNFFNVSLSAFFKSAFQRHSMKGVVLTCLA